MNRIGNTTVIVSTTKTLFFGILMGGFAVAFMLWIFRPATGYLKPMIDDGGAVLDMEYEHVTWWGLHHETLPTMIKNDAVFYEKDGRWNLVEENLYTANVSD